MSGTLEMHDIKTNLQYRIGNYRSKSEKGARGSTIAQCRAQTSKEKLPRILLSQRERMNVYSKTFRLSLAVASDKAITLLSRR